MGRGRDRTNVGESEVQGNSYTNNKESDRYSRTPGSYTLGRHRHPGSRPCTSDQLLFLLTRPKRSHVSSLWVSSSETRPGLSGLTSHRTKSVQGPDSRRGEEKIGGEVLESKGFEEGLKTIDMGTGYTHFSDPWDETPRHP